MLLHSNKVAQHGQLNSGETQMTSKRRNDWTDALADTLLIVAHVSGWLSLLAWAWYLAR